MRFADTPELAAWRLTVRGFVREHWGYSDTSELDCLLGLFDEERASPWFEQLGAAGWLAAAWPRRYGGADLSVLEQFVLAQELHEAGAPTSRRMLNLVGPTIMLHGSEEQKAQHLPLMLRGETAWCQGFSEPGSGSDLASLQLRAVRDGDSYVLNGQKIWTSGAHYADWMFLLARTDPDAPKHRGISYFLLEMKSPGIVVRPIFAMNGGYAFNEVFFNDVRVPAAGRVGEENHGWYVAAATLDFERSNIALAIAARRSLARLARYTQERTGQSYAMARPLRLEIADRAIEIAVAELLSFCVVAIQAAGSVPNMEASRCKLYGTELLQRLATTKLHAVGLYGQLRTPSGREEAHGIAASADYLWHVCSTIAGGTSEIQRNIIATRGLGLPR